VVWAHSLSMIADSNPAGIFFLVHFVCCGEGVSATSRLLVQRNPTECGVSKCDIETSITTKPRSTRFVEPQKNAKENLNTVLNCRDFQVASS